MDASVPAAIRSIVLVRCLMFHPLLRVYPLRYQTPCILLGEYSRYVYYDGVSVGQCHIYMCRRAVA